jgi:hypothetical protein
MVRSYSMKFITILRGFGSRIRRLVRRAMRRDLDPVPYRRLDRMVR